MKHYYQNVILPFTATYLCNGNTQINFNLFCPFVYNRINFRTSCAIITDLNAGLFQLESSLSSVSPSIMSLSKTPTLIAAQYFFYKSISDTDMVSIYNSYPINQNGSHFITIESVNPANIIQIGSQIVLQVEYIAD